MDTFNSSTYTFFAQIQEQNRVQIPKEIVNLLNIDKKNSVGVVIWKILKEKRK